MIAAITSTPLDFDLPIEVKIHAPEGGLTKDSRIMLLQIRCIDKSRILSHYGSVTSSTMTKVDTALTVVTGLMKL